MSCLLWNAGSLNNKLQDLIALLVDEDLDVVAVTETWLSSQHCNVTAELRDMGYHIYHFNRDVKKGGGVALIFKDNIKFVKGKTFSCDSFESIVVTIASRSLGKLNFVVVYRFCELAPALFFTEFYRFIESIFIDFKNLIILGDFNLHVNDRNCRNTTRFYDILSTFSLSQKIESPTHKLGNTLDLVIHNITDTSIKDIHIDFNNKSDHAYIFFTIANNVELQPKKTITVKNFNNVNIEHFKSDLASKVVNLVSNTDGNFLEVLNDFNHVCTECVDKHVETKKATVRNNVSPKWMDSEFRQVRAERRKLYKRWKKTRRDSDRFNFENARQNTHNLAIDKRVAFYKTSIENCNNSHKELFKICNNLQDKSKSTKLPSFTDPLAMANTFNDYFIGKIDNIRAALSKKTASGYDNGMNTHETPTMSQFEPISQEELQKIITSKPVKTSAQDPLPAMLFKSCIDVLLSILTILINLSLSCCSLDGLKDTVITPLLKKAGLDPEVLKNYRPVFNVLYLSKLIERAVLVQCNRFLDFIGGHTKNQSGYKPRHSCETLLIRVTNDILRNMDSSKCTKMLLLDLSAAFDTVDHSVLLDILWFELGFRGEVYRWFVAFLKDRRQAVGVDGNKSNFKANLYGVPQGSVLGPFLFNIYVRSLIKAMERMGFTIHGYADDHQVLYSFQIDFQVAAIRNIVPLGMDVLSNWMEKHFLKLNPSKSQVIIFHPKGISEQLVFERLLLSDGSYIPISQEVYNLGCTLDSLLTFNSHISITIAQGYHLIRNISSIRKYLSEDHMKTLVNALVIAKVDNCNSLLYGISSYDSERLQRFQNSCARLIYRKRKYDHVSGILKQLHWLPSETRPYFKLLCYVYKSIHDLAPAYLSELIVVRREYDLSLSVPRCAGKSGDRAFSTAGPRLWNALPADIRLITTLDKFKSQLKQFLFTHFQQYKQRVNIYR